MRNLIQFHVLFLYYFQTVTTPSIQQKGTQAILIGDTSVVRIEKTMQTSEPAIGK